MSYQASLCFQLHSKEPLFRRLVIMGGSSLLLKPLPPPIQEHSYSIILQALGLDSMSAKDRIKGLLEKPIEAFLTRVPPTVPMSPSLDGDIVPGVLTFAQLSGTAVQSNVPIPGVRWCGRLLSGDCQLDVNPDSTLYRRNEADHFSSRQISSHH